MAAVVSVTRVRVGKAGHEKKLFASNFEDRLHRVVVWDEMVLLHVNHPFCCIYAHNIRDLDTR